MPNLIPQERIENKILLLRGHKVMLDSDLAELYKVTTFNLNKSVKRNMKRFPEDFMFQLSPEEFKSLIFQFGISKKGRGGRRYPPYVFTEQGVAMLSSVLNTERAIHVNIQIMRTFTKLRQILATHEDIKKKLEGYDKQFSVIFLEINKINRLLSSSDNEWWERSEKL
ncbi:MAG: ORF6N domain-containing protein [Candidatus Firestonebacteria bacterium]